MDCQKYFLRIESKVFALWSKLSTHFRDLLEDFVESFVYLFEGVEFWDEFSWIKPDPDMDVYNIRREAFNAHNNYRTMHGCPPLIVSEELTNTAQAWADKLADRGILQYSENPNLGENISVVDLNLSLSHKGEQVVKDWYKEIDNYNYNKPGWKKGSYRVSQLLWKSTSEIGVGFARIPGQSKAYVVVNYRPAGNNNMPGEFERNVLPPQKNRKVDNHWMHELKR